MSKTASCDTSSDNNSDSSDTIQFIETPQYTRKKRNKLNWEQANIDFEKIPKKDPQEVLKKMPFRSLHAIVKKSKETLGR